MGVSLEPIVWIVRGGPKHEKFGDPFSAVVTAIKVDEKTVRLAGFAGEMSVSVYRACAAAFAALGISAIRRVRRR